MNKSKTRQALDWLDANPHENVQTAAKMFDVKPAGLYVARRTYSETKDRRCPVCNQLCDTDSLPPQRPSIASCVNRMENALEVIYGIVDSMPLDPESEKRFTRAWNEITQVVNEDLMP